MLKKVKVVNVNDDTTYADITEAAVANENVESEPVEEVKKIKPIGNQLMIMNEFDLQLKIVSFLRNYYPDVLFSATHGELQDTPNKRITCNMKGYLRGVPDIYIMETNNVDGGYFEY